MIVNNDWTPEFKDGMYLSIMWYNNLKSPVVKILEYANNEFVCHYYKISTIHEEIIESKARERIFLISNKRMLNLIKEGFFIRPINNNEIIEMIGEEEFNEWTIRKIL